MMNVCTRMIAGGVLAASSCLAQASTFPDRPIRLVVPFAPGGASDAIARPLAQEMQHILDSPVVVENRPGAAGNIALDYVANAAPDGYTVLLGNVSTNAMNETSYANVLKIVPSRDLRAVGMVGLTPAVLVASTKFVPNTGAELIAYGKANPGKINYWLPGVASGPHFDMIQLERSNDIQMTSIPYSGGAGPGITALIAGEVHIGLLNIGSAVSQIQGGKLKAIAVSGDEPLSELPGVPTAAQAGLGSLSSAWQGLFVPTATPQPVVDELHQALNAALAKPEVREVLGRAGARIQPSATPADGQRFVADETAKWGRIIRESGVTLD
ncbi:MAG: Bug family tripartite tricarboxylate transporter substrate binding protein [Pigmentiphaga sp.]